jgi:FkbM family methyltransferase
VHVAGRDIRRIAKAVVEGRHYRAAVNMVRRYDRPVEMFRRYLTQSGEYPFTARVRSPLGWLDIQLCSAHDLLTLNEIFCREDYKADADDTVVVDFGSNIGISAAYFLSRGPNVRTYLFEPLPRNVELLRRNLARFSDRYTLEEVAVGPQEGEVEFGWEETGRYGGVGVPTGSTITVTCRDSTKILEDVVTTHGRIDVLKVDIETLEEAVIGRIPPDLARHIRKIYVEGNFETNPLAASHTHSQQFFIARFFLRASGNNETVPL